MNKILLVDFINKKVMGAYETETGQALTVISDIEELNESHKKIQDSIKRINKLMEDINRLKKGEFHGD